MKTRLIAVCGLFLAIATPASAHRLDEYLQATTISVEQGRVLAQMRLTPGVAVFRSVFAKMDTNGDGVLSKAEQQAYAERVMHDLSLTVDNEPLRLRLVSWKFAPTVELKEGRGDVQLDFDAQVSRSDPNRRLVFENHHHSQIAVYLVNCLVPRDPNIQVTAQKRNYQQSRYELDYVQAGVPSASPSASPRSGSAAWLGAAVLLWFAPFVWLWRRSRIEKEATEQKDGVSLRETVTPEGRHI